METIQSYKPTNPILIDKVSSIVFWRRTPDYSDSTIFLPNNICGFGLTLTGDFLVNNRRGFHKMPAFGIRNTLMEPSEIKTAGEFLNISVRLKIPNGLSLFTHIPMNLIYQSEATSLNDIYSNQEINSLTDSLLEAVNDENKIKILEQFLVSKLTGSRPPVFAAIINKIHHKNGQCNVAELATLFSISERTIHRLFNKLVGINPKNYINLIRFRSALQMISNPKNDCLSNAMEAGYYDKSHFIKDFKAYSTITPTQYGSKNYSNKVSDFYNL
jgi:AraC-like DNA-binding protein